MKNFFLQAMSLLVVVAMAACNDDDSTDSGSGPVSVSVQSEPVTLGNSMGMEAVVPVISDTDNLSVFVSVGNNWLSASISGKTLTVKALTANDGPERTGEVTITARNGSNKATTTLTVIQSNLPAASVAFDPATLPLLGNTEGSSFNVDVVTAAENAVAVDIPLADRTWLTASVDGHTLTFTAREDNLDVLRRVSQVKVQVTGPAVSRTDVYIGVMQSGAALSFAAADETTVEIGNVSGSEATLAFATDIVEGIVVNADLSDVSDWIEASAYDYAAKTITLTTLSDAPATPRTGTVTVSLPDYPDTDPIVFTVVETAFPDASLSFDPATIPVLGKTTGDAFDLTVVTEENNAVEVEMPTNNWLAYEIDGKKLTFTAKIDNTEFTEKTLPVTIKVSGPRVVAKSETITIRQAATEVVFETAATTATLAGTLDATSNVAVTTNILQTHGVSFDYGGAELWLGATFDPDTKKITLRVKEANPGGPRNTIFKAWPTDFPDKVIELTVTQSADPANFLAVGDIYQKDGINGIVFWRDTKDPTQARIVSAKAYGSGLAWCTDDVYTVDGVTQSLDKFTYGLLTGTAAGDGDTQRDRLKAWIASSTAGGANPGLTLEKFKHVYHCDTLDQSVLGVSGEPGSSENRWYPPVMGEFRDKGVILAYQGVPWNSYNGGRYAADWATGGIEAEETALAQTRIFEEKLLSLPDGKPLNKNYVTGQLETAGTTYLMFTHSTKAVAESVEYMAYCDAGRRNASAGTNSFKKTGTNGYVRCIMKVTLDPKP